MNLDRYYTDDSEEVSRDSLSSRTQENLDILESIGYEFYSVARKATFGFRPSYLISGSGPNGEEVYFERRETTNPKAGQTYLWVDGHRAQISPILKAIQALGITEAPDFLDPSTKSDLNTKALPIYIARERMQRLANLGFNTDTLSEEDIQTLEKVLNLTVPDRWDMPLIERSDIKGFKGNVKGYAENIRLKRLLQGLESTREDLD